MPNRMRTRGSAIVRRLGLVEQQPLWSASTSQYAYGNRRSLPHDVKTEGELGAGRALKDTGETSMMEQYDSSLTAQSTQHSRPQVSSSIRPSLPKSPLMDPAWITAREKHKLPKSEPSKNPTLFQQALAKNPYALALASPLRECKVTKTNLPSHFLIDFRLMEHPEGGQNRHWWMPTSLTGKYKARKMPEKGNVPTSIGETRDEMQEQNTKKLGRPIYVLASHMALEADKKALVGQSIGGLNISPRTITTAMKANWRPNTADFTIELVRRRLMEALVYLSERQRGYLHGSESWQDALHSKQVAAFLWTGNTSGITETSSSVEPPEFATVDVKWGTGDEERKLPVHNLMLLLGHENLAELSRTRAVFDKAIVTLKHKKSTVDLQLMLWRLQGLVAKHKELIARVEAEEQARDIESGARKPSTG